MCLQEVCLGGLCNSHSRYLRTAFRKVLFLKLYKASYRYLLYVACSSRSLQSQFSVGQTPPYWSCAGGGEGSNKLGRCLIQGRSDVLWTAADPLVTATQYTLDLHGINGTVFIQAQLLAHQELQMLSEEELHSGSIPACTVRILLGQVLDFVFIEHFEAFVRPFL